LANNIKPWHHAKKASDYMHLKNHTKKKNKVKTKSFQPKKESEVKMKKNNFCFFSTCTNMYCKKDHSKEQALRKQGYTKILSLLHVLKNYKTLKLMHTRVREVKNSHLPLFTFVNEKEVTLLQDYIQRALNCLDDNMSIRQKSGTIHDKIREPLQEHLSSFLRQVREYGKGTPILHNTMNQCLSESFKKKLDTHSTNITLDTKDVLSSDVSLSDVSLSDTNDLNIDEKIKEPKPKSEKLNPPPGFHVIPNNSDVLKEYIRYNPNISPIGTNYHTANNKFDNSTDATWTWGKPVKQSFLSIPEASPEVHENDELNRNLQHTNSLLLSTNAHLSEKNDKLIKKNDELSQEIENLKHKNAKLEKKCALLTEMFNKM
jgi:hypothetical protein